MLYGTKAFNPQQPEAFSILGKNHRNILAESSTFSLRPNQQPRRVESFGFRYSHPSSRDNPGQIPP